MLFPERLKECQGIGIVDLVITVGKGKKYGPETTYITQPTRMDDLRYKIKSNVDTPLNQAESLDLSDFLENDPFQMHIVPDIAESSPDIPLTLSRNLPAESPTPKRTIDLEKEFGFDIDPKKIFIGAYENQRRGIGKSGRTLQQRLGDLKKMSADNAEKELERLKEVVAEQQRPAKKVKFSAQDVKEEAEQEMEMDVSGPINAGDSKIFDGICS